MSFPLRRVVAALLMAGSASLLFGRTTSLDQLPSRFAPYQGVRVYYKSLGSGSSAVVFVHGWSCDMSVWRGQIPAVEGRIRALFVDLPGFGRSDKPDVSYTMDYLAGAVDAVMQAAGVDRAVLVGHSMGTPVIRQYDRKYHAKVAALVAGERLADVAHQRSGEARRYSHDHGELGKGYEALDSEVVRAQKTGRCDGNGKNVRLRHIRARHLPGESLE